MAVTIIDLYQKYNTVTNWTALAGAVSGAWIKVSDGTGQALVHADAYVAGCTTHHIPWGPYHFAEVGDPRAQARVFVAESRRLGWAADEHHLVPVLDMERGEIPATQRAGWSRAFMEEVHAALAGARVGIYSSTSWLASLQPDSWPYDWDITWAAEYGPNDGQRHPIVHYTGRVDGHQYTSAGSVPGVSGRADLTWAANLNLLLAQGVSDMEIGDRFDVVLKDDKTGVETVVAQPTVGQVLGALWWQMFNDTKYGPAVAPTLDKLANEPATTITLDAASIAALADELVKRDIKGVTAAEIVDILAGTRLAPASTS